MRASRDSRGFTLVEALVAMVVLSIGMLGIAALGIESLRASRAALVRTEAVTLATDMADRVRSNRDAEHPDRQHDHRDQRLDQGETTVAAGRAHRLD